MSSLFLAALIALLLQLPGLSSTAHAADRDTPDTTLSSLRQSSPRQSSPRQWESVLDSVVPAVVSIRVVATRAFDTESASSSIATGFVIDADQGLILTNRHVIEPGPVVAHAVFLDNEEVALQPVYRDPVHDFGIFRFDPSDVRFMDVVELPLAPERVRVGSEVRIIGNDAGEKISILSGTVARLDRDAPVYGRFRFNDFNTFYIQAASGTSGGSSGSPVIDDSGAVIALNAGSSRKASSSFFLPLDRVVRAVDYIRRGEPVPRGSWQATLLHRPFDELRRLGLSAETEERVRGARPDGTGMLVVDGVVPGGPSYGILELGDVVVEIAGRLTTDFVGLEEALDGAVDDELAVVVERGGQRVELVVPVQDLHEITPDSYLEVGDAVLNELSYQQARHALVAPGSPYVASSGYMLAAGGVPSRTVITAIGGQPVFSLDDAQAAFEALPDGARVPVRFFDLAEPNAEQVAVVTMDRRWFPMQRCTWDPATGGWPCTKSPQPPPAPAARPASTTFPREENRIEERLAPSMVLITDEIPLRAEGVYGTRYVGAGLVVDAERGLVVADRDTVPIALGDIRLTFAGSVEVPGRVVHLHPFHDIAVIQYDPALLGDTPVASARLRDEPLQVGDRVWHVGLDRRSRVVSQKTRVEQIQPLSLPLPSPPFFSDRNLLTIDVGQAARSSGGVLVDRQGRVGALWASFVDLSQDEPDAFFLGLPVSYLRDVVDPLRAGRTPTHRSLGATLGELGLVDARARGLPDASARLLEDAGGTDRRAFEVERVAADAPARGVLQEGDILVTVEGEPAVDLRRIEELSQANSVEVLVSRQGQELHLTLDTLERDGEGIRRFASWGGLLLHAPPAAISEQRGIEPDGVYIAWYWYGSPAARFGLRATRRILEVNGVETPDLDAFLAAVAGIQDGGAARVLTEDLDGRREVSTIELDLTWWPTWTLQWTDAGWRRRDLDSTTRTPGSP